MANNLTWYKILEIGVLPEGRVTTVSAANKSFAVTHFEGKYSVLDNHCPHQGGPLGEGNIENGWLRCPWHGYDFHPCTGNHRKDSMMQLKPFPAKKRMTEFISV